MLENSTSEVCPSTELESAATHDVTDQLFEEALPDESYLAIPHDSGSDLHTMGDPLDSDDDVDDAYVEFLDSSTSGSSDNEDS